MIWLIQQKCNFVSFLGLDQISIAALSSSVQDEYHRAWNHPWSKTLPGCIFIFFAMTGLGMKGSIVKCGSSLANFRGLSVKINVIHTALGTLHAGSGRQLCTFKTPVISPLFLHLLGLEKVDISCRVSWLVHLCVWDRCFQLPQTEVKKK